MPKIFSERPYLAVMPLLLALLLVPAAACSPPASNENRSPAPPAPSPVQQSAGFNQLTEPQRQSLQEFARSLSGLERDWDSFNSSYDSWFRSRNIPVEADMENSLGQLVTRFETIKGLVVNLSASALTRPLADRLFDAVQDEEKALRSMRDSWRPGDAAAFQRYEESRLKVEKSQVDTRKRFAELMGAAEPDGKESIEKLSKAYHEVEASWDKFAQDYDKWKATGMEKDPPSKMLPLFVTSFRDILPRVYGLPRPLVGQTYLDMVVSAAEKEDAAINKLNDNWKPRSDELLAAYEQERAGAKKIRSQAAAGIEMLRAAGLEANRASLGAFSAGLSELNKQWDGFHRDYDSWRNPAGNATREAIAAELKDSSAKFDAIVAQARGLPQNSLLRPLSEMVISAAEKERQGLARLQESWKVYDSSAWRAFVQEQQAAERSRRQIRGAFIDLLAKYNLTLGDVAR